MIIFYKNRNPYSGWGQIANDFFIISNFVGGMSLVFANVKRKLLSEETYCTLLECVLPHETSLNPPHISPRIP